MSILELDGLRRNRTLTPRRKDLTPALASVLRVETTINGTEQFRVYRRSEGDPKGPCSWYNLRRGLADLPRRAEVSRASNERYLDALASNSAPLTPPTSTNSALSPPRRIF